MPLNRSLPDKDKSVIAASVLSDDTILEQGSGVGRDNSTTRIMLTENEIGKDDNPTIHTLAQLGDLAGLEEMALQIKEQDQVLDLDAKDDGGVTALHWAAINAHVGVCEWLVSHGATIDIIGGELKATPLQWAARNGHLQVIQLLLSRSANPNLQDAQGFNTLHLVVHSSAVMPLLYLARQGIAIDSRDTDGHTALMWAAWQGDALSIDILLRHGASTHSADSNGLTPLHWAAVKGSRASVTRLINAGGDLKAKEENGKTPADMAHELKAEEPWKGGLHDAGLREDGSLPMDRLTAESRYRVVWACPVLFFGLIFASFAYAPVYCGVPLAFGLFFLQHHIVTKTILHSKGYGDDVTKSPYFAAIISSSIFYVAICWIYFLLQGSSTRFTLHAVFVSSLGLCMYHFYKAVRLDPGWTDNSKNEEETTRVIEELAIANQLNGTYFCIACMARKPLRGKHCRLCDRCTSRFDHHCPWIWNCVGFNNHPNFLLFVATLVVGIIAFDMLAVIFFSETAPLYQVDPSPYLTFCQTLPSTCSAYAHAPFLLAVMLWASLQLTWTLILLASQVWQVGRQMTTLEVSNLGRYGFMGGRGGTSLRDQGGAVAQFHSHSSATASIRELVQPDIEALGAGPGQSGAEQDVLVASDSHATSPLESTHRHVHLRPWHKIPQAACSQLLRFCTSGPMMQLLGLDRFTRGQAGKGMKLAAQPGGNPFDMGFITNCEDFWTRGDALAIDYRQLHEVPEEGFRRRNVWKLSLNRANQRYERIENHDMRSYVNV